MSENTEYTSLSNIASAIQFREQGPEEPENEYRLGLAVSLFDQGSELEAYEVIFRRKISFFQDKEKGIMVEYRGRSDLSTEDRLKRMQDDHFMPAPKRTPERTLLDFLGSL